MQAYTFLRTDCEGPFLLSKEFLMDPDLVNRMEEKLDEIIDELNTAQRILQCMWDAESSEVRDTVEKFYYYGEDLSHFSGDALMQRDRAQKIFEARVSISIAIIGTTRLRNKIL